jgi:hypothetical protein
MIYKGKVSSVELDKARVTFSTLENVVSTAIKIATHIGELLPGDEVAVTFFSDNMQDGLIIAKC